MKNEETEEWILAYIGLGSNLGNREATLESAVRAIGSCPNTEVLRTSNWYENPAVGIEGGNDFLNGVVEIQTELSPRELLSQLLQIEIDHGRDRTAKGDTEGYQNRTLDLDILIYGDQSVDEDDLKIPHPRMWEREFVRVPLAELGVIPQDF